MLDKGLIAGTACMEESLATRLAETQMQLTLIHRRYAPECYAFQEELD